MSSSKDFNIITGEVLQYQAQRQHRSLMNLEKKEKDNVSITGQNQEKIKLPRLGVPKDQKSFKYAYMNPE